MCLRLSAFFVLILISVAAIAETGGSTSQQAIPSARGGSADTLYIGVGGGLAMYSGSTGWAINVNGMKRVSEDSQLFAGADLGLNFWSFTPVTGSNIASSGATGIQLLPTIVYRFNLREGGVFYPYIGLSAGPHIRVDSETPVGSSSATTRTSLLLEVLLRPGVYTHISDSFALNLEPKFGSLGTNFVFLPQVSAVVAL